MKEASLKKLHTVWFLEKAMAPHSSTLAWRIPRMEEPGRLQSMGSLRVGHDWVTSLSRFTFMHWRRKWQPTPVFLPGESQGQGSLVGLLSVGSHRVGHDWSDLAVAAAVWFQPHDILKQQSYTDSIKISGCQGFREGESVSCSVMPDSLQPYGL